MSTTPQSKPIVYDGLMQANLARVFGERDTGKRFEAIHELYTEDAVLNEPYASARGHTKGTPWSRSTPRPHRAR